MYISYLTNYSTTIPIPYKSAEMAIQGCKQHIYATFGGSFTLILDNAGAFKNDLFEKSNNN